METPVKYSHGKLGDHDNAVATYKAAEDALGASNSNAVKVYSDHLNYLYTYFESNQQDPGKWTNAQKEEILAVYEAGNKLDGISSNPNWIKRSSTMEGLSNGSIEKKEETTTESSSDTSEETGEDNTDNGEE